ncbi:MAG: hypothetical protein HYZ39_03220 [Mycolicibacterium cosmeticum]|nr:hypothetical protein [Mycolicibacterium cosmeticum]
MSGKHRVVGERTKRIAVVSAATMTVTALTVGAAAPQPVQHRPDLRLVQDQPMNLAGSTSLFPQPGVLPDITGGLGNSVYNTGQNVAGNLSETLLNAFSLPHLLGQPSVDLNALLNLIPENLLDPVLDAVKIDLGSIVHKALTLPVNLPVIGHTDLLAPIANALIGLLHGLNITDASGVASLNHVLKLVGIDLDGILTSLQIPDFIRIVTPGPTFALLKAIGLDLGWTPGTPNAVFDRINSTPYFDISAEGLVDNVLDAATGVPVVGGLVTVLHNALDSVAELAEIFGIDIPNPSVVNLRVPIVAGLGLGAFAAGAAYDKVLADLSHQPGGVNATSHPIAGSFTVLPLVLLNNMGRANGGLLSRFYPLADLLGIDVITPETAATHSGGTPLLRTGLSIGGANLIPVKVDATVEYQPFSDFAAWPNPVTLLNNLIAGTIGASYIVRGLDVDGTIDQIRSGVGDILGNLQSGDPLAVNLYLTLPTKTLPLLEPLYLTGDVLNAVSFGTLGQIPVRLANALAPALTSLVNLGYTDVVRNPDGTYTRTLDDAGTPTPFMSFPHVNPARVLNDVLNSLVKGIHKEFFSGHPTATPNLITNLVHLVKELTSGSLLKGLTAATTGAVAGGLSAANALPAANARTLTVSAASADKVTKAGDNKDATSEKEAVPTGKHAAPQDTPVPEDSGTPAKHALPDDEDAAAVTAEDPKKDDTVKADDVKKDDDTVKKDDLKKDDVKKEDVKKDDDTVKAGTLAPQKNPKPKAKKHDPLTTAVNEVTHALAPKKKKKTAESASAASEGRSAASAGEAA